MVNDRIILDDRVVCVAGDWHGNEVWARSRIMSMGDRGIKTILHLGDFGGVWPGPRGKRFLMAVDSVSKRYGVERVLVTEGNHSDWTRLTTLWASPKRRDPVTGERLPLQVSDRVTILPRGYRFEVGGRSVVSLGGAPSIDYEDRTEGRDWWPEEMIEWEDVERTIAGGYADIFLAHDSPGTPWATPKVQRILDTNPLGFSEAALEYAAVGRERIHTAFEGVAARLFCHGHMHVDDEHTVRLPGCDYDTKIWSLACDKMAGNVRLLDLETLDDPAR